MKKTNFSLFAVLFVFAATLMFTSCGEDTVTGCTDPAAENYNADAEEDDGNCVYAGDKFIGSYVGTSMCSGGPIVSGLSNDTLMFSVSETVGASNPNEVSIAIPIQGTPVSFASTVSGDVLSVNEILMGLPFPNPFDPTMTIQVDVEATGEMVYDSSDDSTTGDITVTVRSSDSGATLDTGTCTISGVKQ